MDHPQRLIAGRSASKAARVLRPSVALLAVVLLGGCTWARLSMRSPGEHNKTMPAKVAKEYHCEKRDLPFFQIEKNQLLPEKAKPGEEMGHRIVYVMCPRQTTEVASGLLDTRILYKGKVIFKDVIQQDLKPGRWVLDTLIPLPVTAEAGVYALHVEFRSKYGNLSDTVDFIVKPLY